MTSDTKKTASNGMQPCELPEAARRAMEPARRYILFDVRNAYDTVAEAIEAARGMPGFADHYIACAMMDCALVPAHIGGDDETPAQHGGPGEV